METDKLLSASRDQLNLILGFFPRVESKASVLLAINTGMLAFTASNAPPLKELSCWMDISAAATLLLLAASISVLYRGAFPRLAGGEDSLIYFRRVASRTEHKFIEEFKKQGVEQYSDDLLAQAWRNSAILQAKFNSLKHSFILTALAIIPWVATLALFAAYNSHSKAGLLK
jgi:hypothetical protein